MVTACLPTDMVLASELGGEHDKRFIEKSGCVQIGNQGGQGAVQHRPHLLHLVHDVVVVIPTRCGDLDETYIVLHQSTGKEKAPAQFTVAVTFPGLVAFHGNIKGGKVRAPEKGQGIVQHIYMIPDKIGLIRPVELLIQHLESLQSIGRTII